jgi:hypothetical protein
MWLCKTNIELCKSPFHLWSSEGVKPDTHFSLVRKHISSCFGTQLNRHRDKFIFTFTHVTFFIVHSLYTRNTTDGKHFSTHTWQVNGSHIPHEGRCLRTWPSVKYHYRWLRHVEELWNFGYVSCCKHEWIDHIRSAKKKRIITASVKRKKYRHSSVYLGCVLLIIITLCSVAKYHRLQ